MNWIQELNTWLTAHPVIRKPLNTFWQAFTAFFLAGVAPVLSNVLQTHNLAVAQAALGALVVSAGAAAFSAVKTYIIESLKEE